MPVGCRGMYRYLIPTTEIHLCQLATPFGISVCAVRVRLRTNVVKFQTDRQYNFMLLIKNENHGEQQLLLLLSFRFLCSCIGKN